jgi:glycosyltransferase involved in cell wall biosynthesis
MYSGNLGLAHSFDEFLEAARRLREREDVVFLFVGGGPRLEEVRAAKERDGLDNVRLLDYFPREQLHISLSVADVHLISMRREMTGIVVPGKLYGVMASGRPALFVGPEHCETADTVRQADCGLTVRLGDVDGLVESLCRLAGDTALVQQMGARGRAAFLSSYEKSACSARWNTLIADLLPAPSAAAAAAVGPRVGVTSSVGA